MKLGNWIGLGGIALYLLGAVFPQALWGVDSLAFLPLPLKLGLPACALLLIALFAWKGRLLLQLPGRLPQRKTLRYGSILTISLTLSLLYYFNPVAAPVYGDAAKFDQKFTEEATVSQQQADFSLILDADIFHPKIGERTVLNAVQALTTVWGVDHREAFRRLGAMLGFAFALLWLIAVHQFVQAPGLRLSMATLGLTAHFTLLFCGHIEIYAPAILLFGGFGILQLWYLQAPAPKRLLLVAFVFFIALKLHAAAFLLMPGFVWILLYSIARNRTHLQTWFTWKSSFYYLILPIFLLGALVYFFLLQDHADPRFLQSGVSVYDRLFLPLVSPEAPLDRYILLSGAHLLDYLNMVLHWSMGGIGLLLVLLAGQGKSLAWQQPGVIVAGLNLLLFFSFFFMVNPLLGMTVDWDLFSLPAVPLLIFCLALVREAQQVKLQEQLGGGVIAICLLSVSFFLVNSQSPTLGKRLESIGQHSFKTYWIRSAGTISTGWKCMGESENVSHQIAVVEKLSPYAVEGNDIEFAYLLTEIGKIYRKKIRDLETAQHWHARAAIYAPKYKANLIGLLECYFFQKDWEKAYLVAKDLIAIQYPSPAKSLAIGVQIALEAGRYQEASAHCAAYLELRPQDETFRYVLENLKKGTNLDQLKTLFNQR